MSRVQLALNVADIDEAVVFYSKLFGTEPAKRRPGYANFAVADPPLKLVLIENAEAPAGTLNHLGVEVESADDVGRRPGPALGRGTAHRGRGAGELLLRHPGQGVGGRPGRRALGDLHRAGRCRRRRHQLAGGRPERGRVLRQPARSRRHRLGSLRLLLSFGHRGIGGVW